MKIVIVGTGYVGLVTGACLAEVGVAVTCVDVIQSKIDHLKNGIIPIYEPGLSDIVKKNVANGRLQFSTKLEEVIQDADAAFIAVGTPPGEDGSADLKYVLTVADEIGSYITSPIVVITKSTVPVGTSEKVRTAVQKALDKRGSDLSFEIVSNPEFLKEGAAIQDFMHPDRIVIGVDSENAKEVLTQIYQPFVLNGHPLLFMDIASAEMAKYAANAMLATRISFMNDIANLCELVGANVANVRKGIGSDPRIGNKFMYAGIGYGGSCFPKDVKALIRTGKDHQHHLRLLEAVEDINNDQKKVIFNKIVRHFDGDVKGKTIAIWGLAFKPNTDDMREAPALVIINSLLAAGAKVNVTDPVAIEEAKKILGESVHFCQDIYEAAKGADGIALVTEWNEFRIVNWKKIDEVIQQKVLFDGRNVYDDVQLQKLGYTYYGIGK